MKLLRLILCLSVLVQFNCKDDPQNKPEPPVKPEAKNQKIIDQQEVLKIGNNSFSNDDFKNFIQVHYSGILEKKENVKLLSRCFDVFVERKILSILANREKISVSTEEYMAFLNNSQLKPTEVDNSVIVESIRVNKYLSSKVYAKIDVTRNDIRGYYNSHRDEFTRKNEVELYQILLKDKEKALNISSILKNYPQRFEELARTESKSKEASNNGFLGNFEKGILPKEMEDVVFSLNVNEISPVVESPYGFHIFKVTKRKRNGRLLFLKNVEHEIKDKLLSEKLNKAYMDHLSAIQKDLRIEILSENLYFKYKKIEKEANDEARESISTNSISDSSSE